MASSEPQTPTNTKHTWLYQDVLVALFLALGTFLILASQLMSLGVTWDEAAPGFVDAKNQAVWMQKLLAFDDPFSKNTIDRYWTSQSDHPSLWRSVAGLSYLLFHRWFDEMAAMRAPFAALFSILIATIYLFLRRFVSAFAALAGAFSLLTMPRLFGHAHLYNLDIAMTCWWFWTAIVGYFVLTGNLKPIWFGVFYAIAFTTKLHAVFLPFPLLAWAGWLWWNEKEKREAYLWNLIHAVKWAAILTPVFYIALQPFLWHGTWARLLERFFGYAEKTTARPIPLMYLGERYGNNTPWHYPLVMVAVTVPVGWLFFFLLGILNPILERSRHAGMAWVQTLNANGAVYLFVLLNFLTPLMVVLLPLAQAYDGCRLFLPCFSFLAMLIGMGFQSLVSYLESKRTPQFLIAILFGVLAVYGSEQLTKIHPYYLAYYNELAGGMRGAREKGFETTYWCDALTPEAIREMDKMIPAGSTLRPMSMAYDVMAYYQSRGWLKQDINLYAEPPYDFHLLQCRQGMFTQVENFLYHRQRPLFAVEHDMVMLFALYGPLPTK